MKAIMSDSNGEKEFSYEERRAWDRFMATAWRLAWSWTCSGDGGTEVDVTSKSAERAGLMADSMMAERRKRFGAK
jgi:hypothetical protein